MSFRDTNGVILNANATDTVCYLSTNSVDARHHHKHPKHHRRRRKDYRQTQADQRRTNTDEHISKGHALFKRIHSSLKETGQKLQEKAHSKIKEATHHLKQRWEATKAHVSHLQQQFKEYADSFQAKDLYHRQLEARIDNPVVSPTEEESLNEQSQYNRKHDEYETHAVTANRDVERSAQQVAVSVKTLMGLQQGVDKLQQEIERLSS